MTGTQQFVGAAGAGLLVLNYWTGPQRPTISAGLFSNGGDVNAAHRELTILGGEALFVVVAVVLAGLGQTWASAMTVVMVGLFVLWALNHYGKGKTASTPLSGPTGIVKGTAA